MTLCLQKCTDGACTVCLQLYFASCMCVYVVKIPDQKTPLSVFMVRKHEQCVVDILVQIEL